MQYIKVRFLNSNSTKKYLYRCIHEVNVDDLVVVQANSSYSLATVTNVGCERTMATKDVLSVVDLGAHFAKAAVADKIVDYEKKLNRRLEEFRQNRDIQQLLKQDSVALDIQNELEALRFKQSLRG